MRQLLCKYAAWLAYVVIAGVLSLFTFSHAQERATGGHSVGSGQAALASMPDGLYITSGARGLMILFLLVEKGQWVDPYEWVQRRGVNALNAKFLHGQNVGTNSIRHLK